MKIKIQAKNYNLPVSWSDISVKEYRKTLEFWDQLNPETKKAIEEGKELSDDIYFNFVIGWANAVIGADLDILRRVDVGDLNTIWQSTSYLLGAPETFIRLEKLKGVEITESITTASGMELIGSGSTYEQWALLNKLSQIMEQKASAKNIENLKNFLAIIYPVKDETPEQLAKRVKSYDDLNALELWSGWFFFAQWLDGWRSFTQYLEKNQGTKKAEKLKAKLARLRIWHAFANSKIGKFLGMRSPKRGFWDLITTI